MSQSDFLSSGHQEMEFYHNYCMNHSKFVLAAGRMWMGRCPAYSIITALVPAPRKPPPQLGSDRKKDSMNDTHFT